MFMRTALAILGVATVFLLGACSPKETVTNDPWAQAPMDQEQAARPDTLTYDFLAESVPTEEGGMEAEADLPVMTEEEPIAIEEQPFSAATETIPATQQQSSQPPSAAIEEGPLFWVQIFASSNRQSAEEYALETDARLVERVRILYLEPHYKVLVGGFPTREEAESLRSELVGLGYEGAWIFEK